MHCASLNANNLNGPTSHPAPKGKGCITQGKEIIVVIMIKLFGVDFNDAGKQVTVLIKGSVFITQKGSIAPCCQTDSSQLAGLIRLSASSQLPSVLCPGWL